MGKVPDSSSATGAQRPDPNARTFHQLAQAGACCSRNHSAVGYKGTDKNVAAGNHNPNPSFPRELRPALNSIL